MPTRINIDGRITPPEDARIPVLDHGFLYGDSVYESFRTYRQGPILFERNFARLAKAAGAIGLTLPFTEDGLRTEVMRTIDAAGTEVESLVRIIVTRGVGDMTPDPEGCHTPGTVIIVLPLAAPAEDLYENGIAVTFSALKRDTHIASIKTGNLIHQVLGAQEAHSRGAVEAIFLNSAGCVSDGTRSNIYFVQDGSVRTPSAESGIVAGITRSLVLDIASEEGIEIRQETFSPADVAGAEEVFITSTTRGVLPVTRIDGRVVGTGTVGPVTRRLIDAFRAAVDKLAAAP